MTRRTAAERHLDSAPLPSSERDPSDELAEMLMAFHHPIRRWLTELLGRRGTGQRRPAGRADRPCRRLGQPPPQGAPPAGPDRARTRAGARHPRELVAAQAAADDVERRRTSSEGTLGRRVAETAEAENFRFQVRAMQDWLRRGPDGARPTWRSAAELRRHLRPRDARSRCATSRGRLTELVATWSAECIADAAEHPDAERRPVAGDRAGLPQRAGAAMSAAGEPEPARDRLPSPPVRRDPMVLAWLAAVGLSWFGDYAWNVALAWTAAHTLSPVVAGVVLGAEMLPQAAAGPGRRRARRPLRPPPAARRRPGRPGRRCWCLGALAWSSRHPRRARSCSRSRSRSASPAG